MSHRNMCIVLDLDETLVHTFHGKKALQDTLGYDFLQHNVSLGGRLYRLDMKSDIDELWTVKRPHVDSFIRYVTDNFGKVIVWSAGTKEYVHRIVDWLFNEAYPDRVFSREFCDNIGTKDSSIYTKPITKLGYQVGLQGIVRLDNTLFIDDNTTSTSPNPANAITIPAYRPVPQLSSIMDDGDDALKKIMEFCMSGALESKDDIRKINLSSGTIFQTTVPLKTGLTVLERPTIKTPILPPYAIKNIYA